MTNEQGAAFVNASVARALIRAAGMTAENECRKGAGRSPAYGEAAFEKLVEEEGIGSNHVITVFNKWVGDAWIEDAW